MSKAHAERRSDTPARTDAGRARWQSWFASTGTPPEWGLVRYLVCGLVVGAAFGLVLPDVRGTLLAALTGAVVAASRSTGPSGVSRRVAAYLVLAAGAPTGDVAGWAGHRLLDTVLGCAIALVATYLLWPRDREAKESVPVLAT